MKKASFKPHLGFVDRSISTIYTVKYSTALKYALLLSERVVLDFFNLDSMPQIYAIITQGKSVWKKKIQDWLTSLEELDPDLFRNFLDYFFIDSQVPWDVVEWLFKQIGRETDRVIGSKFTVGDAALWSHYFVRVKMITEHFPESMLHSDSTYSSFYARYKGSRLERQSQSEAVVILNALLPNLETLSWLDVLEIRDTVSPEHMRKLIDRVGGSQLETVGDLIEKMNQDFRNFFLANLPRTRQAVLKGFAGNIPVPVIGINPIAVGLALQDIFSSKKQYKTYAPYIVSYMKGGALAQEPLVLNNSSKTLHKLSCPFARMIRIPNARFLDSTASSLPVLKCMTCFGYSPA